MNKVSVFRNGPMHLSQYFGEVLELSEKADTERPAGRPGRTTSLYATATLPSVMRWVNAHLSLPRQRETLETYEFKVDADKVYVYPLGQWEKYSWSYTPISSVDYWNAGITLTEFLEDEEKLQEAEEWEVLVGLDDVIGTPRRVTRKRLVAAAGEQGDYFAQLLKTHVK